MMLTNDFTYKDWKTDAKWNCASAFAPDAGKTPTENTIEAKNDNCISFANRSRLMVHPT